MFEPVFMRLALAASIATGAALGVLGVYLVVKRTIFLGLVIANAATLGAALAEVAGWPSEGPSLAAAVCAAVVLGGVETSGQLSGESLMGWAYALASSATVLILSGATGGSTDTLQLLFGNILAVQPVDVVRLTTVAVLMCLLQTLFARRFLLVTFDPESARVAGVNTQLWSLTLNLSIGVASAVAVHAVGALSTFALLTLPAATALLVTASVRTTFVVAAVLGMAVPSAALALSYRFDLPPGPASVALLALGVPLAAAWRLATRSGR